MTLLDAALDLSRAGCSVIPVKPDGTKAPAVAWKTFQETPAGEDQIRRWFSTSGFEGLGVITGSVSGSLELLEVEGRAAGLVAELAAMMTDNGFGDLWQRICAGYLEQSPSGGLHWLYRVEGAITGNTKLARRHATDEELLANPDERIKVLIETRGEGGYVVTAPSGGRTHASGEPWRLLAGGPDTIPTLTIDERDALIAIASSFDRMPVVDPQPAPPRTTRPGETPGRRPGDDFNARATWDEILTPRGWQRARSFGGSCYGWIRPGKNRSDGISATTGRNDGDNLYVFSTSTEFETEKAYSKFAAYTLLEHGGDWSAAAKALAAQGYGEEPHRTVPADTASPFGVVGNLATVAELQPRPTLTPVPERTLTHSDDANALALIDTYGDRLRHCSDRGRWYAWDGHMWAECPRSAGVAREYAKRVARALPETEKKDVDHKKRSLSAVGVSAMLTQAATDNRVTVTYDELDAHPWELNTPAGIVDLRTGEVGPADPARLHTRTTACAPDFKADRTIWLQFLDDTFGADKALINYLQRLVGYSAIGLVGPHVLPFCHGSGGNGKGVFLEANMKVLGGYATTAPSGFLMAKQHPAHETEVARLSGARMVLCSEVNEEDHFDEAKVKQLTGGDTLTARFMHQDHFTFKPTHQLWLMGNHQPTVKSGGRSFWRRLRLIPFLHEVPAEQVVDDLQGILARDHGAAILAWIIEGAVAYFQHGLGEPPTVTQATESYAHDQDTVARFLEERCLLGGGEHVQHKVAVVRSAYESWCHENGEQPVTAKAFGIALTRAGVGTKRSKTARMYVGLALVTDDENASPGHENASPADEAKDEWWSR